MVFSSLMKYPNDITIEYESSLIIYAIPSRFKVDNANLNLQAVKCLKSARWRSRGSVPSAPDLRTDKTFSSFLP